jgi:hypothetical protein
MKVVMHLEKQRATVCIEVSYAEEEASDGRGYVWLCCRMKDTQISQLQDERTQRLLGPALHDRPVEQLCLNGVAGDDRGVHADLRDIWRSKAVKEEEPLLNFCR